MPKIAHFSGFMHLDTPTSIGIHFEPHTLCVLIIRKCIATILGGTLLPVVVFMAINALENHQKW